MRSSCASAKSTREKIRFIKSKETYERPPEKNKQTDKDFHLKNLLNKNPRHNLKASCHFSPLSQAEIAALKQTTSASTLALNEAFNNSQARWVWATFAQAEMPIVYAVASNFTVSSCPKRSNASKIASASFSTAKIFCSCQELDRSLYKVESKDPPCAIAASSQHHLARKRRLQLRSANVADRKSLWVMTMRVTNTHTKTCSNLQWTCHHIYNLHLSYLRLKLHMLCCLCVARSYFANMQDVLPEPNVSKGVESAPAHVLPW